MVRTCVDSAIDELTQLERTRSLPETMKIQIQNLQLDLRFLKMFFWCCENWGDATTDALMGSDMGRIQETLKRAAQGLFAAGSIAIRGARSDNWDLISANFLENIEQLKPQIGHICLDLLDRSLQCTYSTSQGILKFTGDILKNLKEFLKYKTNIIGPPVKKQIRALEEILGFLKNFVDVTERGITKYEKFQDFWNHVQTRANNAACVLFIYWICDWMDVTTAPRMSNILSAPLQKIKPCVSELTGMYLGVLRASEPALSDPVMTSKIAANFVDFLLQHLAVSMKDYVPILGEGLIFLIAFLVHPPSETIKGQELFTEADAVLRSVASLISLFYPERTNEDMYEHRHILLLDLVIRVDIIKAEVKELYLGTSDLLAFDFPKTNGLGFVDFFVESLEEMLEIRDLKPFEKEKIARIQKGLLCLRCFMQGSFELRNEEMEIKSLWTRILNVTYKAEHVIDCLMHSPIWYSMICLSDVIEEIENIKIDVQRIEDENGYNIRVLGANMTTSAQDKISTFNDNADAVGFENEANAIMDMLIGGSRKLQIVSIAGMPGIGKTTLANKVYNLDSVKLHFHKRAWCTVSRANRSRELLLAVLECVGKIDDIILDMIEEDLADRLRKNLLGCRYLIVIDDIWEAAAWNKLKDSFPNGDMGSRILFTSQIDNVASETQLPFCFYHLQPLSDCKSWELFQAKLNLSDDFPPRLLEVGWQIVQNCKGLPLAIVTIAGLLSRTDKKLDFWIQIAQNTSSFIDKEEGYKEILELSYNYLPDHLKPFFLYFGAFQEDKAISVRKLIQLWVAEGFIPKMKKANVEDVAKQHLNDLTARSLVIVTNRGSNGEIKACRIHNLLRELCLAKVKQESFLKLLHISRFSFSSTKHQQYRLCIYPEWLPFVMSKSTGPHVRSLLFSPKDNYREEHTCDSSFFINFKLLRVLNLESIYFDGLFPIDIILLVHLRYLAVWGNISEVPSSIEKLWNLETFVVKGSKQKTHLPNTIWSMKKLKHVNVSNISFSVFEIAESAESEVETFGTLNVSYGEAAKELLRRLAKVRKLRCILSEARNSPRNCNKIPGLEFPSNLRSLNVLHIGTKLNLSAMRFPETLEKLTLSQCGIPWSQISFISKLPNLQILKLQSGAFVGETWDLGEDEFPNLKFLKLFRLDISKLNASYCSFPNLKHLVVERCSQLAEIPYLLGETPTLQKIEVRWCSEGAANSARELQREFDHLEVLINSQKTGYQ